MIDNNNNVKGINKYTFAALQSVRLSQRSTEIS